MYVIVAPIQIKEGNREAFVEALVENARGAVNDEPGCLRFDVVQDAGDRNRLWIYEVYEDEAAFQAHTRTPHFKKCQEAVAGMQEDAPPRAGAGSYNIWPTDGEWK